MVYLPWLGKAWDDRRSTQRLDGPRGELATRGGEMAYLTCPTCRLTVYRPVYTFTEECPRCRAKLGKASRLFSSSLPPRLMNLGARREQVERPTS